MVAFSLAALEFHAGDAALALMHASEGLAAFRALDYTQQNAVLLCNMSTYLIYLGRYDEAEARAREVLNLPSEQQTGFFTVVSALQAIGGVAALRPQGNAEHRPAACIRAALLLGFVEAHLSAVETSEERRGHDQALAALRDVLGADAAADLMAEGALMTQEQAVKEARAL